MINIPKLPAGRYRLNCDPESSSGEAFRDDVLIPALGKQPFITVNLAPEYGVPVSWNEEVFGGLVRRLGVDVVDRITLIGEEGAVNEARSFMRDACGH